MLNCAGNVRGERSRPGASRAGSNSGATSHKYKMPTLPAIAAGSAKSNKCIGGIPISAATETTRRLVEGPMVVAMPPIKVAKPTGTSVFAAGTFARAATLTDSGRLSTSGVLLTNALVVAMASIMPRSASRGCESQLRTSQRPVGSSAPVRTSPWPAIISAEMAIRAG